MLISRLKNQQTKPGNKPRGKQDVTRSPSSRSSNIRASNRARNKRAAVMPGSLVKGEDSLNNKPAAILPEADVREVNSPIDKRADVLPVEPMSPVVKQAEYKPTDHKEVAKETNLHNQKDIAYLKRFDL